jgi:shikimate kinase
VEGIVILTGFMGAGKSTTGRALARLLGWDFVDLDEEVEGAEGKAIPRIFAEEGEDRFREAEAQALSRLLSRSEVIVATGGGVLLREENRKRLAGRLVVNLDVSLEECLHRLRESGAERPLLAKGNVEEVRSLYERRRPLYEAIERRIQTQGRSPEEVAREIAVRFLGGGRQGGG